MSKPLVVMLGDDQSTDLTLIKKVDESYLQENFGTLLDYMLNPSSDGMNSDVYNAEEEQFASTWRGLYQRSQTDSDIGLELIAIDKNDAPKTCHLHKIVGDYSDSIVKVKQHEEDTYKGIDLIISDVSDGGMYR